MVKVAEKQRKYRRIMPAMGLLIAVTLGILSWFLAPEIITFARTDGPAAVNERLSKMNSEELQYLEYAATVFVWLILFGGAMLIVSIAVGEDPMEEEMILRPRENASPKEVKKYLKKVKQMEDRRLRQAEAKKKAEYEQAKKQYGTLLSGNGKGETGTPGNQGNPDGDPNATNLKGVSTGSGMVGGGLGNRGVKYEPTISDNSQKVGKIVMNVCVDKSGKVISAEYTQRGSTTTDSDLRDLAERSARKFVFTESTIEKQCGTITVDFKVR